eukprot:5557486-Amphidinium_carterae.1
MTKVSRTILRRRTTSIRKPGKEGTAATMATTTDLTHSIAPAQPPAASHSAKRDASHLGMLKTPPTVVESPDVHYQYQSDENLDRPVLDEIPEQGTDDMHVDERSANDAVDDP